MTEKAKVTTVVVFPIEWGERALYGKVADVLENYARLLRAQRGPGTIKGTMIVDGLAIHWRAEYDDTGR